MAELNAALPHYYYPEMDYYDNESLCDVVFVIEEERLHALRAVLSVKNRVFRDIFEKNVNNNEIVIEGTSYEAFGILIHFLYCNQLVLEEEDRRDLQLLEQLSVLSDRYSAPLLKKQINEHLKKMELTLESMTNQTEDITESPESDHFMNESVSDVVFVVEGQRVPALKAFLSAKNLVFRAMFSENFKESKDREVVIEKTSFTAFKTLIRFLYCDQLVLEDINDLEMVQELCKLSDRYQTSRLTFKLCEHLYAIELTFDNIETMTTIAIDYEDSHLITKVMTFTDNNFHTYLKEVVNEIEDSTDNRLLIVMANTYRKVSEELTHIKNQLNQIERGHCRYCGSINVVDPNSTGSIRCMYGHSIDTHVLPSNASRLESDWARVTRSPDWD